MALKEAFDNAEIIHNGNNTPKGSHTYLGYGWKIRKKYVDLILKLIDKKGYEEWNFSDLISPSDFATMNDEVMDISKKSMFIDDKYREGENNQRQILAPTHEVPIYSVLNERISTESNLPLKFVHTGSAYRAPKKYPFPFSLGERRSFIEAHGIFDSTETAKDNIPEVVEMVRKIIEDILIMPSVEVERPLLTNNPVSKYTLCHDLLLPDFKKTQIAGMVYFHDDIFAKPFDVEYTKAKENYKVNHTPSGLHFGFSDNLLLGTIVNSYDSKKNRFFLPEDLLPYQVSIIVEQGSSSEELKNIETFLENLHIDYKIHFVQGKSNKTKVFNKNKTQGIPIVVGIRADGGLGCFVGDIGKSISNIQIRDIESLLKEALIERKEILTNKKNKILSETLVDGNHLPISGINQLLSKGKIVKLYMKQDDEVIQNIESSINGEILGFRDANIQGSCYLTKDTVEKEALLSRRF